MKIKVAHYQENIMSNEFEIKQATNCGARPIKKASIIGKKNPRWKGGITVRKNGRVMVYSPNHPNPQHGRYVYRAHLVAESKIGRLINSNEVVHHINGVVDDDRPENLEVMHYIEHNRISCGLHGKWAKKFDWCVKCLSSDKPHKAHGLCEYCYEKARVR